MGRKAWAAAGLASVLAVVGYTQYGNDSEPTNPYEPRTQGAAPVSAPRASASAASSADNNLQNPFAACSADGSNASLPKCATQNIPQRDADTQTKIDKLVSSASFNLQEANDASIEIERRFVSLQLVIDRLTELRKSGGVADDLPINLKDEKAVRDQLGRVGNEILDQRRRIIGQNTAPGVDSAVKQDLMHKSLDVINRMADYADIDTENSYRRLGYTNSAAFSDDMYQTGLKRFAPASAPSP